MRDPFPIVCRLGDALDRDQRTGWATKKALILLVAVHGDWNGAAALADALGVHPEEQEKIHQEALDHPTGRATPEPHPHRRKASTP